MWRHAMVKLLTVIVFSFLTGFFLGYIRALRLSDEQKRRIKRFFFELKEMPRRTRI